MGKPSTTGLVEVVIARGTLDTGERRFGPGDTVSVTAAEAKRLKDLGVVRPDDYQAPVVVQDGKLSVTAETGPTVSIA